MGGRHHPYIDINNFVRTNGRDVAFLQNPQQFHLHAHWHVANFVQKQRACVRFLELASVICDGSGKGTLFMAKQLAF